MRLRFTIRDLLWLTIVVALTVGWWVERRQLVEANQQLTAATQKIQVLYGVDSAPNRQEILKALQEAYADFPNVQFIDDPAGRILIGATHGEHIAIRLALRALEKQRKMSQQAPASIASPDASSGAELSR